MAITWRNIQGDTGHRTAASIMQSAQQSIDSGLGHLQNQLRQHQATQEANWENTKQNNTNAYLDRVSQFTSPEELQAAQARGELDQMRQGFGAQIDAAKTRDAVNNQVDLLQQRYLNQVAHDDKRTEITQRPLTEQAEMLALNGDEAGLQALFATNPDLRGKVGHLRAADERGQVFVDRERDTTRFNRDGEMHGIRVRNANQSYEFAQENQRRAGELHSLNVDRHNMELGKVNLSNQAKALQRSLYSEYQQGEKVLGDAIKQAASKIPGVSFEGGKLSFPENATSAMKRQMAERIQQDVQAQGVDLDPMGTLRRNSDEQFRLLGVSPTEQAAFTQELIDLSNPARALNSEQQKELDGLVSSLTARQTKQLEGDASFGKPTNVAEAVNTTLTELTSDGWAPWFSFDDNARRELADTLTTLYTKGIEITDPKTKESHWVDVSPALVKIAATGVNNVKADDIKDNLKEFIRSGGVTSHLKEGLDRQSHFSNELNELRSNFYRSQGISPSNSSSLYQSINSFSK